MFAVFLCMIAFLFHQGSCGNQFFPGGNKQGRARPFSDNDDFNWRDLQSVVGNFSALNVKVEAQENVLTEIKKDMKEIKKDMKKIKKDMSEIKKDMKEGFEAINTNMLFWGVAGWVVGAFAAILLALGGITY